MCKRMVTKTLMVFKIVRFQEAKKNKKRNKRQRERECKRRKKENTILNNQIN